MRILHVIGGLDRGGAETWLVQVLRHINREKYQMDFLVHTTKPCAYDEEVKSLGSRIIPCLSPSNPVAYAYNFRRVLKAYGPYDCVHSHVHHFSGYVMLLAAMAGVPVRIVQSHTAHIESNANTVRKAYLELSKALVRNFSTKGVAVSALAGDSLFPADWKQNDRWSVLPLGIDLKPFEPEVDGTELRKRLHIPPDAFVVGHVGRFVEAKNHKFFFQIARSLAHVEPRAFFLLVGDGPLRPAIEASVKEAGMSNRFLFTGVRDDIPALMIGAMDVMLFPSLHEGFALAVMESQAAGLPCLISDVIPDEVDRLPELIQRESISADPNQWANRLCFLTKRSRNIPLRHDAALLQFSVEESTSLWEGFYIAHRSASKLRPRHE